MKSNLGIKPISTHKVDHISILKLYNVNYGTFHKFVIPSDWDSYLDYIDFLNSDEDELGDYYIFDDISYRYVGNIEDEF